MFENMEAEPSTVEVLSFFAYNKCMILEGEGKMMAENRMSNYEKMKNDMADVFLKYDQKEMIRKFSLESNQKYLFTQTSHIENGKRSLKNQYFSSQNSFQVALWPYSKASCIYLGSL